MSEQDLTNFRNACLHDLDEAAAAGDTGVEERRAFFEGAFRFCPELAQNWPDGNNNLAYVAMRVIQLAQLIDVYNEQFAAGATSLPPGVEVH